MCSPRSTASSSARTVNRDEVYEGAEELAVDLGEHIDFIIASLREVAADVGLKQRAGEMAQENAQHESRE